MISACSEQNQISKCKGTDYSKWTNCFGKQKITDTFYPGVYEGQYLNGKFHGQGTYTWADGNTYAGEWKNNKRHGQGTNTWSDGTVKKGIWKNNKLIKQQ